MVMENNDIPQHWLKYDLYHTSPAQSNLPNGIWAGKYLCCTQEERKQFKVKPIMVAGNAVQDGCDAAIIDKLDNDVAAREGEFQLNLHKEKFNEEQLIHFEKIADGMQQMVLNGITALSEIFPNYKKQKIKSENSCWAKMPGVELPMTGFIDYESKDIVVEFKSKQRGKPKELKKGGYSSAKGSLPDKPQESHVKQTAFYKKATNKKIFIVYVNDVVPGINPKTKKEEKGFVIFDESHDALNKDAIDWAWESFIRKNIIRQNIVSSSNSLTDILSKIDPEFDDPFWDFGDEYVARCKQLWRSI
tara:strand:- start:115 stop:1023 length:909 start_codon:yes stop_codon:yes gene_type:complete